MCPYPVSQYSIWEHAFSRGPISSYKCCTYSSNTAMSTPQPEWLWHHSFFWISEHHYTCAVHADRDVSCYQMWLIYWETCTQHTSKGASVKDYNKKKKNAKPGFTRNGLNMGKPTWYTWRNQKWNDAVQRLHFKTLQIGIQCVCPKRCFEENPLHWKGEIDRQPW